MAGSWQPDPTKRYAERFKDPFGNWTSRVRNADRVQVQDPVPFPADDPEEEWRAPLSKGQAIGLGLGLWLFGVPALLMVALFVGLAEGFGGDGSDGGSAAVIIAIGAGGILAATIALIVQSTRPD